MDDTKTTPTLDNTELVTMLMNRLEILTAALRPFAVASEDVDPAWTLNSASAEPGKFKPLLDKSHLVAAHEALNACGLEYPYFRRRLS